MSEYYYLVVVVVVKRPESTRTCSLGYSNFTRTDYLQSDAVKPEGSKKTEHIGSPTRP